MVCMKALSCFCSSNIFIGINQVVYISWSCIQVAQCVLTWPLPGQKVSYKRPGVGKVL